MTATKQGLHQKLAQIRAEFGAVEKTGTNSGVGGGYRFVEATEIARRFVELASAQGITMLPIPGGGLGDRYLSISGKQHVIDIAMHWRITDSESGDFIDVISYGQGADNSDKALPKAQTNAMKYAILLVLQKAGDDPEKDNSSNDTGEVSSKAVAAEARTAARRAARSASAAVPQVVEQAASVEHPAQPTEEQMARAAASEDGAVAVNRELVAAEAAAVAVSSRVTEPASRGPRATKMASDALKAAIWARSHEVGLDEFQLKSMARTLTGKESSKDWTQRDGEKVRAKLDSEGTVWLFKDMKAVPA